MPGTVKIPVVGTVSKRTAAIAAVLIAGTVVLYEVRKRKAAAAGAGSGATATDPAGNTGTIDPSTGFVLGSAQDQQALAGLGQAGVISSGTPQPGQGFTSNAAWSQAALQFMTQNEPNADAGAIAAALGAYINGQPLSAAQLSIVEQAIAFENLPPVAGPNGYPPAYRTSPPGPIPPVPGKRPPGPIPPVPGKAPARVPGAVKGLRVAGLTATVAVLTWDPTPGATSYEAKIARPAGYPLHRVASPTITFSGLKPRTTYTAYVTAEPASSGHSSVTFKTT